MKLNINDYQRFENIWNVVLQGNSKTCSKQIDTCPVKNVATATVTDENSKSCTCCHGALTLDHATTLVNTLIIGLMFVPDTTAKLQKCLPVDLSSNNLGQYMHIGTFPFFARRACWSSTGLSLLRFARRDLARVYQWDQLRLQGWIACH